MGITSAVRDVGKVPNKRKRRRVGPVTTVVLKEGEIGVRLVADSRHLLGVKLVSNKRARTGATPAPSHPFLRKLQQNLHRYFRQGTPLGPVPLGWTHETPFQRRVLRCVQKIPFGEVKSYGWLAKEIRVPGGARACGQALRHNPFPLFVPCHRIVSRSGVGGFSCGVRLKKKLLSHEEAFSQGRRR